MNAGRTARERARAELTEEIKDSARRQLATEGAAGLSLRAISRELGMVSSALYRYFPSRDDLLTAQVADPTVAHRRESRGFSSGRSCRKRAPFAEMSHTATAAAPNVPLSGGASRKRSAVRRLRAAASYMTFCPICGR